VSAPLRGWLGRSRTTGSPPAAHYHERGQALVELALVIPLLLIMALAVFDFARVLSHAITLESAAREAADFGGLYPWHWQDSASAATTEAHMQTRACTAASTLTDYEGDDPADIPPGDPVTCTNPTVTADLINDTAYANCFDVPRDEVPCRVEVTLEYEFEVIVPLRLSFGDTVLGLPSSVDLTRTSTFAVSNFELDEALAP
jgi:Flp pilus assembly protein TadG